MRSDFRFLGWCALALALHGVLLVMVDSKGQSPASSRPRETLLDAPVLDFIEASQETESASEAQVPLDVAPARDAEPQAAAPASSSEPPRAVEALVAEQESDTDADFSLPGEAQATEPEVEAVKKPERLSLAQLGIGVGPRLDLTPARKPAPKPSASRPNAQERLQQSFVQSAARESQKLGLGLTSEVKGALLRATQSAKMSDEGSALFVFVFDEVGKLRSATHNTLGGSAADWIRVSSLVKATLRRKPVEIPTGSRGAQVSYAVSYSFVLPSGSKGARLKWSLTQEFDVADIGKTKQALARVTLKNYQVF